MKENGMNPSSGQRPGPQQSAGALVLDGPAALKAYVGTRIGVSDWRVITQDMVDQFAQVTDDEQWIHVDPDRATNGPFGTTIAHGYLTLSLCSALLGEALEVNGVQMVINYGLERVRYPAPTRVGERIRGVVDLQSVKDIDGGVQAVFKVTVEPEQGDKPVCVAEPVFRYVL
jgi:acyl dehydratase